jgi:hypothetical protein
VSDILAGGSPALSPAHAESREKHSESLKCLVRARAKLMEGLEAWHRQKTPHAEERLTHYYLVVRDCQRNVDDASERVDAAYWAAFEAMEAAEVPQ